MVVATDAPLIPSNLERLAKRAGLGLSRTGAFGSASSGDFIIAFSTATQVRRIRQDVGFVAQGPPSEVTITELPYHAMSPLFEAVVEATEEAVLNSLFRATAVSYRGQTVEPLPIPETLEVLRKYHALNWTPNLGPAEKRQ
jgi:D-aminopeptidase